MQAFADDISVLIANANLDTLEESANQELMKLENYSRKIKLQFCPVETKMMIYNTTLICGMPYINVEFLRERTEKRNKQKSPYQ